jgi:hypothetical protein
MDYIKQILKSENPSIEDYINCLEQVKRNGDIAVIKFDGERSENQYTIFISFPIIKKREMIRADENDLKLGLAKVITKYIE